jgi:hypothetical protein
MTDNREVIQIKKTLTELEIIERSGLGLMLFYMKIISVYVLNRLIFYIINAKNIIVVLFCFGLILLGISRK